jgi:hypothetical protein
MMCLAGGGRVDRGSSAAGGRWRGAAVQPAWGLAAAGCCRGTVRSCPCYDLRVRTRAWAVGRPAGRRLSESALSETVRARLTAVDGQVTGMSDGLGLEVECGGAGWAS